MMSVAPKPTGILHITIPVGDLTEGCAFYEKIGMKLTARRDDYQMAFLRVGDSDQYVILHNPGKTPEPFYPTRNDPPVHHAFTMPDKAAYEAMKTHLADVGIEVFGEHYRDKGALTGWQFYLRDPWGNDLEFINFEGAGGGFGPGNAAR
jgi:catechol-2,3-dioxygenase